jgi:hypothetical protein
MLRLADDPRVALEGSRSRTSPPRHDTPPWEAVLRAAEAGAAEAVPLAMRLLARGAWRAGEWGGLASVCRHLACAAAARRAREVGGAVPRRAGEPRLVSRGVLALIDCLLRDAPLEAGWASRRVLRALSDEALYDVAERILAHPNLSALPLAWFDAVFTSTVVTDAFEALENLIHAPWVARAAAAAPRTPAEAARSSSPVRIAHAIATDDADFFAALIATTGHLGLDA